jgi:hypothetical protein
MLDFIRSFIDQLTLHYYRVTVDTQTKNATNLALKGILGVRAMAEISRVAGMLDEAQTYKVRLSM